MGDWGIDLRTIERALAMPGFDGMAAQWLMATCPRARLRPRNWPGRARQAAVLIPLFPIESGIGMALIRRADLGDPHGGQIGFPGGELEPGEDHTRAAIRECEEELGINPADVRILGFLTPLYILPSDFEVCPVVGYFRRRPAWHPSPVEVADVIESPLEILLDDSIKHEGLEPYSSIFERVPWYSINGAEVWGATAMMLSELEQRLRAVLP